VQRLTFAAKMGMPSRSVGSPRGVLFGPMIVSADREDTLTRAELLAVRGMTASSNGVSASNGSVATEPPPSAAGADVDAVARSCAWCGDSIPAGTHGRARYCGDKCRRAAKRARERPAAAAASHGTAAAVGPSIELVGNGVSVVQGLEQAPASFPAAEVDALLGLGSVGAVTLEGDGWRLVVHPRT
jgi:hypothetical protein